MHILVVDDHPFVCEALTRYIEQIGPEISAAPVIVKAVHTMSAAVSAIEAADPPDFVFLDLNLDAHNQSTATLERFQAQNSRKIPVIVFTALSPTDESTAGIVRKCFLLGAKTVIFKGTKIEAMFVGLRRILANEDSVSPELVSLLLKPSVAQSLELTPRQWQVARGVSRGLQNKEIAQELGTEDANIRQTVTAIYRRLGIRSRVKLADIVKQADTN